jgi:hypothetical protein
VEIARGGPFLVRQGKAWTHGWESGEGGQPVPTVSIFYGIIIRMFFNEHAPPHFHAEYGEFKATVAILERRILAGSLPGRALQLVLEWAELHRGELLEDWEACRRHQAPSPIDPLE